jgi:hypothetical protein
MPERTALIHKDQDGSKVFMKLHIFIRSRTANKGSVYWTNPIVRPSIPSWPLMDCPSIDKSKKRTHLGAFKWRCEGHIKPKVNKSNPGLLTGWIFTDDKFYSWVKEDPEPILQLKNKRNIYTSLASQAWALKKAAMMWKNIERDNLSNKRMKLVDNTAVDVRVVLAPGGC